MPVSYTHLALPGVTAAGPKTSGAARTFQRFHTGVSFRSLGGALPAAAAAEGLQLLLRDLGEEGADGGLLLPHLREALAEEPGHRLVVAAAEAGGLRPLGGEEGRAIGVLPDQAEVHEGLHHVVDAGLGEVQGRGDVAAADPLSLPVQLLHGQEVPDMGWGEIP